MRGLFVEPFYGGSHRAFLDGLVRHSSHELVPLTLPGGEWRRRMRRGAQELAAATEQMDGRFDFIVATDMLDLAAFLALTRPRFSGVPVMVYFHENQFTYPRLRGTKFNSWFGAINYLSACVADVVAFNSEFHRQDFLAALRSLDSQPNNWLVSEAIEAIAAKSVVLPIGVELEWLMDERVERPAGPPIILWNHRWEFDKVPSVFARTVTALAEEGIQFRLALAGQPGDNPAPELTSLTESLAERVYHAGFLANRQQYARLLWESSIVVSTTRHEFFGVGMVEALYCGCFPIVPARFNYPALVPPALHGRTLFTTEDDFRAKLRAALTGSVAESEPLRESAERFAWRNVGVQWDAALTRLVEMAGAR